ncbi:MAG TPA: ABC-2 transporter permease, partial [Terriglobales bacterium]|nr:ABC-2 transporter permease [Terriglobales bacterium]
FFNAAILPLVYKFGVEKSRLMMFAIFSLPVVGLMLFIRSGIELSEQAATAAVIAFPFIAIAAFALSYMISLRIYATREL